jgi:dienelactone hydrolase
VAILSHGATTRKEDLYDSAVAFADAGWRAIAYDAGSDREADLRAVTEYARDTGAERIVLLGTSLGASLSIAMASELDADAVVSLSASSEAFGALQAAGDLEVPLLAAAAEGDGAYASDARTIADAAGVEPRIVDGARHGVGMFKDHPELLDEVVAFADDATSG